MKEEKIPYIYWAFITYSHRDRKWSEWLHRSLETYKIPKRILISQNDAKTIPKRIFPIFRDREELPGASDLGYKINLALRQSRYLIVICSPHSAKSHWVNEEVKTFKALGRESRILCLIIDGEPNASDKPDSSTNECFPKAIRYHVNKAGKITQKRVEPIAADARPEGDGKKNALLKLIAGILDVGLDALKQRDQERRLRIMVIATIIMAAMLVSFAALALTAIVEKNRSVASQANSLFAQALLLVDNNESQLALANLAQAIRLNPKNQEAIGRAVTMLTQRTFPILSKKCKVRSEKIRIINYSHNGKWLITGGYDKFASVWDIQKLIETKTQNNQEVEITHHYNDSNQQDNPFEELLHVYRASPNQKKILNKENEELEEKNKLQKQGEVFRITKKEDKVLTASFNQDDNYIVIGTGDGEAQIMKLGKNIKPIQKMHHDGVINAAVFSPDGKRVATASSDNSARIWPVFTKRPHTVSNWPSSRALRVNTGSYTSYMFSESASWIPSIALKYYPFQYQLLKHNGEVNTVTFDVEGKHLLTTSEDGKARLWDVATGKLLIMMQHNGAVRSAEFSPDGTLIATASSDGTAGVWNAKTGTLFVPLLKHKSIVTSVTFSPDGRYIVTTSADGTARIWEARTGILVGNPLEHSGSVVEANFSPDGKKIVTASWDGTARVWEVDTTKQIVESMKHGCPVLSAIFSPDGKHVITSTNEGDIWIWAFNNPKFPRFSFSQTTSLRSIKYSKDFSLVVTLSENKMVKVWDTHSGKLRELHLQKTKKIHSIDLSNDGQCLIITYDDGTASIWDFHRGKLIGEPFCHQGAIFSAILSPLGDCFLTISGDRTARVWDTKTAKPISAKLKHEGAVIHGIFSSNSTLVATSSEDCTARIWDVSTGFPLTDKLVHHGRINSIAFSPDNKRLLTASEDYTVKIWDTLSGVLIGTLQHPGVVWSAEYSPDGMLIATACFDGVVRIWDANKLRPTGVELKHKDVAISASFSPNSRWVITSSNDHSARIWDVINGYPIADTMIHNGMILSAKFSNDGNKAITASNDGSVMIWETGLNLYTDSPAWLPHLLETIAGYKIGDDSLSQPLPECTATLEMLRSSLDHDVLKNPWNQWAHQILEHNLLIMADEEQEPHDAQ
jgi:WD40 repeat protein